MRETNEPTTNNPHTQAPCYLECQLTYQTISGCSILDLERIEREFALKKQTNDTKDGALLILYCWLASERLYELFG